MTKLSPGNRKQAGLSYRYTKVGVSVLFKGKVVTRTRDIDGAEAFATGWYGRPVRAVGYRFASVAPAPAPAPAPAITTSQNYRGIAITTRPVMGGLAFQAFAGDRSTIGWAQSSVATAIRLATAEIDDAFAFAPERAALWLNDTTHWRVA